MMGFALMLFLPGSQIHSLLFFDVTWLKQTLLLLLDIYSGLVSCLFSAIVFNPWSSGERPSFLGQDPSPINFTELFCWDVVVIKQTTHVACVQSDKFHTIHLWNHHHNQIHTSKSLLMPVHNPPFSPLSVSPSLRNYWSVFSHYRLACIVHACMLSWFSCVQLGVTLWTVACQAPLSVGFSRQEYWSQLPYLPSGALNPGMGSESLKSPALAGKFFTTSATWEALLFII